MAEVHTISKGIRPMMRKNNSFIVAEANFILAAREVGYRSPADAIAELVDNAVQADARTIRIFLREEDEIGFAANGLSVAVLDDGRGMNANTLRTALQFGGTDRFNDRSGLGRFGMGLPSSSVSQARRLEVYTWTRPSEAIYCFLDVDEVAEGRMQEIPRPQKRELPDWARPYSSRTGTLVVWRKCDRLEKDSTVVTCEKLCSRIGRMFRYFIWSGVKLSVNGVSIMPIDPLFCHPDTPLSGAKEYGKPLTYKFRLPHGPGKTAAIRVRFSELPIAEWHDLAVEDKRRFGIVKGAGVSLVRAGREVAYGWHFMGKKRRENYDDWWRCEISFGPELDEYFRPNYTKQAIHPAPVLEAVLSSDLESIAHTLNSRARRAYAKAKGRPNTPAALVLSQREKYLPPIGENGGWRSRLRRSSFSEGPNRKCVYSLLVASLRENAFYSFKRENGTLVLTLNRDHPFFERVYAPLCHAVPKRIRVNIDCLLFALARAEAEAISPKQRYWYNRKRVAWSNILATFLGS
jgi:hypothetical protein